MSFEDLTKSKDAELKLESKKAEQNLMITLQGEQDPITIDSSCSYEGSNGVSQPGEQFRTGPIASA